MDDEVWGRQNSWLEIVCPSGRKDVQHISEARTLMGRSPEAKVSKALLISVGGVWQWRGEAPFFAAVPFWSSVGTCVSGLPWRPDRHGYDDGCLPRSCPSCPTWKCLILLPRRLDYGRGEGR